MADERPVRASDEDRERVVAALKEHCAAGRLTLEELPGRVERAYAAATLGELAELTGDLPAAGAAPPRRREAAPGPARGRPWIPGNVHFSETVEFDSPVSAVETAALRSIAPNLARYGFRLVATERPNLIFVRTAWIRTQRVQLTLHPLDDDRTHLMIHGTAPLALRRAFAELRPDHHSR